MGRFISNEEMQRLESTTSIELKPKFISDQDMEQIEQIEQNSSAMPEAALEGFGQGATLGYLPQLQALVEGILPNPTADVDAQLKAKGFTINQPEESYITRRDENIRRQQSLAQENPNTTLLSLLAGNLATLPASVGALNAIKPLKSAADAGKLTKLGKITSASAIESALQNPGDTEGEITPIQVEDRGKNALLGAGIGAVSLPAAGLVKGATSTVTGLGDKLQGFAERKAFKASGAMLKDFRSANDRKKVNELGRAMIKEGLIEPGASFETIAKKSAELKNKAGQVIGDTYKQATDFLDNPQFVSNLNAKQKALIAETDLNAKEIADQLEEKFKKELKGKPGSSSALKEVEARLQELRDNGPQSNLTQIQEFKEGVDDILKYNKQIADMPLAKQYLKEIRDALKDKIDKRIVAMEQILGKEVVKPLKQANKQYGNFAEIARISKDRVSREEAKNLLGLTDAIVGAGGLGAGAITGGVLGGDAESAVKGAAAGASIGLVNKLGKTYGNPALTSLLDSIGGAINKVPVSPTARLDEILGTLVRNPTALGSAVVMPENATENRIKNRRLKALEE